MNATPFPAERSGLQAPPRHDAAAAGGELDGDEPAPLDAGADGAPDPDDAAAEPAAAATPRGAAGCLDEAQLQAWLACIAERDERALSALYDATLSRVYGLVLRIVRRPAWAEEVVEETYFQVWRQALRFDPARGRALGWLLGMARSRAIDALRREARFQHDVLDDELPLADSAALSAAELIDAARGQAHLQHALLGLGAQPRQLVALAFFSGLSHEEIAAQTALPLGTVKSQIRRALLRLRELLGPAALQALPG